MLSHVRLPPITSWQLYQANPKRLLWYMQKSNFKNSIGGKTTMNYKEFQTNKQGRKAYGIKAFRVLEITEKALKVRLPKVFGENRTADIPVTKPNDYSIDESIDLILHYTVCNGSASSYQVQFVGRTPDKFALKDGEEIGR